MSFIERCASFRGVLGSFLRGFTVYSNLLFPVLCSRRKVGNGGRVVERVAVASCRYGRCEV